MLFLFIVIFVLLFIVPSMDQGSSAAMTAQVLWCWLETQLVEAPQTGLTTGARHPTLNPHGCQGIPTGFMMSWASIIAACGRTTAIYT